ncbi:8132_t:CDS:2 [Funneliformis geosporum]|nr:8132_t:CDS:2 [Funneliformis geosporum]
MNMNELPKKIYLKNNLKICGRRRERGCDYDYRSENEKNIALFSHNTYFLKEFNNISAPKRRDSFPSSSF